MKLIGAGFGRTGTMSLKAALERLGYGPCFHMIDLIRDPTPLAHWEAAYRGDPVDWEAAFDGWEQGTAHKGDTAPLRPYRDVANPNVLGIFERLAVHDAEEAP